MHIVLDLSILSLSTIFQLDIGPVTTVWHFFVFHYIHVTVI